MAAAIGGASPERIISSPWCSEGHRRAGLVGPLAQAATREAETNPPAPRPTIPARSPRVPRASGRRLESAFAALSFA